MSPVFPLAKLVIGTASSVGIWKVVGGVVKNNISVVTRVDKIQVWTGTVAISTLISAMASERIEKNIDDLEAWYEGRNTTDDIPEEASE
jgi:hypothetical protein